MVATNGQISREYMSEFLPRCIYFTHRQGCGDEMMFFCEAHKP